MSAKYGAVIFVISNCSRYMQATIILFTVMDVNGKSRIRTNPFIFRNVNSINVLAQNMTKVYN